LLLHDDPRGKSIFCQTISLEYIWLITRLTHVIYECRSISSHYTIVRYMMPACQQWLRHDELFIAHLSYSAFRDVHQSPITSICIYAIQTCGLC
jgi:hypothetical protein